MEHQILAAFARPIVKVNINCDGIGEFFDTVIKPTGGKNNSLIKKDLNLKHYHNNKNVFCLYDELKPLGDEILKAANSIYNDVLNYDGKLFVTNAWFNECEVGGQQLPHTHHNSLFSGTLYIRTDENTNIEFLSPFNEGCTTIATLDNFPNLTRENKFGYGFHFHKHIISVGDTTCLFWPSYMKHGYFDNQTPNRLSLSFNLMPESFNSMYSPYFAS